MYRPRLRDGSGHGWERESISGDRKSTTPLDARTNDSPIVLKPVSPLSTTFVALILSTDAKIAKILSETVA